MRLKRSKMAKNLIERPFLSLYEGGPHGNVTGSPWPGALSAAHGNYCSPQVPASLAGWVTTYLACAQKVTTCCVFTAHCT